MSRRLVPWSYPVRSILVRWPASLFSALGIAMTVAVLCGVFALRDGFEAVLVEHGADDVLVYLRPGAKSEGESAIPRSKVELYKKERPEVARDESGQPLAAGECFLALFLTPASGEGLMMIPIRGVEPASRKIQGSKFRILTGRDIRFGSNELIVGEPVSRRVKGAKVGESITINTTPFEVVGVYRHDGAYNSEIWGDVDRIAAVLDRPVRQRVIAKVRPGTDVAAVVAELDKDKQLKAKVQTERVYLKAQTTVLGSVLTVLGTLLTSVLGIAAVLGAANTMLASVGSRTREVGILRAVGFGEGAILAAFLVEAALIGLVGGVMGGLLVLPLDGIETGTLNWNSFTDVSFAFRVDAGLLLTAIGVAVLLGVLGGVVPSWRASRLSPVEALRTQ
jgi:ABC-type antimicrobial peptide transport system permease subunit